MNKSDQTSSDLFLLSAFVDWIEGAPETWVEEKLEETGKDWCFYEKVKELLK